MGKIKVNMSKIYKTIGLMSGTSLDGIDAALIETDGLGYVKSLASHSTQYDDDFKKTVKELIAGHGDKDEVEYELTVKHADAVAELLYKSEFSAGEIDLIGFHGQTIDHRPHEGITIQIGDGELLAKLTDINVVYDFRSNDVAHGGQGAPLIPVFHKAMVENQELPVAVINIGGVANISWIGKNSALTAFDTGPGNALIDDWIYSKTGNAYDKNGEIAAKGEINQALLQKFMSDEYFNIIPPKSLDRNDFAEYTPDNLSLEDGAATLAAYTIYSISSCVKYLAEKPRKFYVTGGGRNNKFLMDNLAKELDAPVHKIDEIGFDGDMVEAQGFAYLAVRSLQKLPISFPETTGVAKPTSGGKIISSLKISQL